MAASVCLLLDVCLCVCVSVRVRVRASARACQCSNGRMLLFTTVVVFRNYNCGIRECWGNQTAIIILNSSVSENDQDVEITGKYLTQFR